MTQQAPLPSDMWALSDELADENLRLLHAEIVARLRRELPGIEGDTIRLMQVERVASLYIHIRAKEQTGTFAHDRAFKETTQLWYQMSEGLRKSSARAGEVESSVDQAMVEVAAAVAMAVRSAAVPEEVKRELLNSISAALGEP